MHMRTKNTILKLVFLILPILVIGQENNEHLIISKNKIQIRKGYKVSLDNDKDTILLTEEFFNKRGRITNHIIHKADGSITEYEYHYKHDTIRTCRLTKFDNNLYSKTILTYDSKNRHIKSEDYDNKNNPTGTYEIIKYRKRGRIIEKLFYDSNKLVHHSIEEYDKSNTLKKYARKKNGKWTAVNLKGETNSNINKEEIYNYQDSNMTLIRTTEKVTIPRVVIGITEQLELKQNDVFITERFYNGDGLIQYEAQSLNSKPLGKKKYKYAL